MGRKPTPSVAAMSAAQTQALQASVQARLQALRAQREAGGGGGFAVTPGSVAATDLPHSLIAGAMAPKERPRPLLLDDKGRMVDAAGNEIKLETRTPDFMANVREKEELALGGGKKTGAAAGAAAGTATAAGGLAAAAVDDITAAPFFDERLAARGPKRRERRMFRFNEPGKYQDLADKQRAQAQLEILQEEIAASAKKVGIDSATKLALLAPKRGAEAYEVPDVEWWDAPILPTGAYADLDAAAAAADPSVRFKDVTQLIQHPILIKPPAEPAVVRSAATRLCLLVVLGGGRWG